MRRETEKYYQAAYKIIKEDLLDQAITNSRPRAYSGQKVMICLKWKGSKEGYVFDPEKGVRIGRQVEGNELCIREIRVSSFHCRIFLMEGQPVVQDLNSSNGTWIKRGLSKKEVTEVSPIFTGDTLIIGSVKLKIILFCFDMEEYGRGGKI